MRTRVIMGINVNDNGSFDFNPTASASPAAPVAIAGDFVDGWHDESGPRADARAKASGGGTVPSPVAGALLQTLATSVGASAVVEVGTGTGVTGLWLLSGMRPEGVLTTVDADAEAQRLAKESFNEAGVGTRARCIAGRAVDVLPRLTDRAYDLVVINGDPLEYATHVEQAARLLRPGGALVVLGALGETRSATDLANRDAVSVALRDLLDSFKDQDSNSTVLLPIDNGILVSVTR